LHQRRGVALPIHRPGPGRILEPHAAHAIGYLRTSSATNVGEDKNSEKRQRDAILAGANHLGLEVVDWFYDAAVSGDVPIADRPGFIAMFDRIDGNGVGIVLVESADRFARKMLTAELGILLLVSRGVTLMTAAGENLTDTDDEIRVAFRQMAMTVAQLEETRLVKKLRVARDRASQRAGRRVEGMKGYTRGNPTLVALAKEIRREGHTLLDTAAALAERGYVTAKGKPFSAARVKRLVEAQ
jgi:DNA invertase Pin-like site-specific DNA recombinase